MATSFVNGVVFTPAANGTADFVVSAAVTGWQTPAAAGAVDGASYRYRAASTDNSQWEIGTGTYTVSTTTLARTTVSYNSLGTTAKIAFTVAPQVTLTVFAADLVTTPFYSSSTAGGTSFTLPTTPASSYNLEVIIGNVHQPRDGTAYTFSGTTLTISESVTAGILVEMLVQVASTVITTPSAGSVTTAMIQDGAVTIAKLASKQAELQVNIDGGGSVISTGTLAVSTEVPFNCTIVGARLFSSVSGSIVIDIWKDTYANYPPTIAKTITASALPTLSSATKYQDITLTGWTTSMSKGDILKFNVNSVTTCTAVTLVLDLVKV